MVRRFTILSKRINVFALLVASLVSTVSWAHNANNHFKGTTSSVEVVPGFKEIGIQPWGPESDNDIKSPAYTCPCTIFTPAQAPTQGVPSNDFQPSVGIENGIKFQASLAGFITGIRFYKVAGTTGAHTGQLYDATGPALMASAPFGAETASGWQQVNFGTSIPILASHTYVAAIYSASGDYAGDAGGLTSSIVNPPLTGLCDGCAVGNGVFLYSAVAAYPTSNFGATNYWVDPVFFVFALPVQLTNFTASLKGHDVQLGWTTASEQKNKGFEIQRSTDGSTWTPVSFVSGAGTSQLTKHYLFVDKNLAAGKYYYRLNQLDLDGNSKFSSVVQVAVTDRLSLEILQNHPNPFRNSTQIDIIIPQTGRIKLMLFDQMGRPIRQLMDETKNPGTYQIQVDRKGLSAGVYYYKLEADGQSLIKKMTIL